MPTTTSQDHDAGLSEMLATEQYIRDRLEPRPADPHFLVLADLIQALRAFETSAPIRILDYGCGGSPYRVLFPNSDFVRADFTPGRGLDFLLPADSALPATIAPFDLVLSTQVLEHVPKPANYVAECFRVLKPGGRLLLTTHGLFEDHGCPYDFTRWTADGLQLLLREAGFRVLQTQKLTCGPRAISLLLNVIIPQMRAPKVSPFGFALWLLRSLWRLSPGWLNRSASRFFSAYGVLDAATPHTHTYIAILIHAERPSAEA
jgi:SAM-dependent methyltransferase